MNIKFDANVGELSAEVKPGKYGMLCRTIIHLKKTAQGLDSRYEKNFELNTKLSL